MSHFRFLVHNHPRRYYTHVHVYTGKDKESNHSRAGILMFTPEEWQELRKLCLQQSAWIDIVEEE